MSKALHDITAERSRQISEEGWSPEHDDGHGDGALARAAACYAANRLLAEPTGYNDHRGKPVMRSLWPWDEIYWKPGAERRRQLVKAGALIVAEIERLDRALSTNPVSQETER